LSGGSVEGDAGEIADLAQQLRARQALGRSEGLNRLFDYLAERAAAGARPKEFEVAAAVFGRTSAFDGSQDASVRVAVHRLRRKLDDFYAGAGRDEPVRLTIPKGEYRMMAEPRPEAEAEAQAEAAAVAPAAARPWRTYGIAAIAVLALLNLAAWAAFWTRHGTEWTISRAQGAAPWRQMLMSEPPTLLVLGDYYIFGEIDQPAGVDRLIRQYSINSAADLDDWLMDNPKAMGRYRDLDLYYLPVGAAFALRSIVPVISHGGGANGQNLRVVMASDLTPEMLKRNSIVYLGYLSGLGMLRDPVFAGSRFAVGETYDELEDTVSHRHFVSQGGGPSQGDVNRRDYGYVAAFRGPTGNRIVIIAGARDSGLQEAAEAMANPDALKVLAKGAAGAGNFEALYESEGIGRSSLGGKLIVAAPRSAVDPWTSQRNLSFPQG
jgi:hypothetical protein